MKNFYEILGLQEDATDDMIKKSYRKLAMEYHPDRNPNNQVAELKFKEIQEAYDTLSDTNKRRQYDHVRKYGENQGSFGFGDIFNNFVRRHEADLGLNIKTEIVCSFEESIRGARKNIKLQTNEPCKYCHGSGCKGSHQKKKCARCHGKGRVLETRNPAAGVIFTSEKTCDACAGQGTYIEAENKCQSCDDGLCTFDKEITIEIPPRSVFGSVLRLIQHGLLRKVNGKRGDCFLQIVPENHDLFKISTKTADDGILQNHTFDLWMEIPITLSQAINGCTISVPLLDRNYDLSVPPMADSKFCKRVIGAGLYQNHGGRGDVVIEIVVEINKNIQKLGIVDLLKNNENVNSNPKSFAAQEKIAQQKERIKNG